LSLMETMRKKGIQPDIFTYGSIITACDKVGDWEKALAFLKEMECCGIEPNVICFTSAISACGKVGKWKEAMDLLSKIPDPNMISFGAAITACGISGQWQKALKLFSDMQERNIQPEEGTFISLIGALCDCVQLDEAFRLIPQSNSYIAHHILLNALVDANDSRASDIQDRIREHNIQPLHAEVRFVINDKEERMSNGLGNSPSSKVNRKVNHLFNLITSKTEYRPQVKALPVDFLDRASDEEKVKSLKFHAEKKALAKLLLENASELEMRVNIKVCMDCHLFLKHASKVLGRKITVFEKARMHVFHDGQCSCGY